MRIHPTAIIETGASLGDGVEVGPFSVIGPEAVVGDGTIILSHVVIEGAVRIGRKNNIGHGSIIGGAPQDLGFTADRKSGIEIGDGNVFREYCTIHRGTAEGSATIVGHENFLMTGAHLGHNCQIGNNVIIANNCLLGGYVRVADRAFLGGGSVFHQNVRVGRLVITQGNSGFGKDLPPFVVAAQINAVAGLNVVGLRRAGFSAAERDDVKRAFKLLYRSGLNIRQALEKSAEMEWTQHSREFFDFVGQAGARGIVAYHNSSADDS
ncbi:MAG: acyl-ACP--UDP-N-acetylglucosamine O-acyltransferase [Chthoniobacterales bacterium]